MTARGTTARSLAEWALGQQQVPADVRRAVGRHLFDGLACLTGAVRRDEVPAPVEVATGLGGPPQAGIPGTDVRVSAPAAALAIGSLVHALDFDDTHAGGLVHATAVTLPAALAVGQETAASGAEVLVAAVVGYETACRVAQAAPYGFQTRGLHATMVAGVFSSAIVSSRLLGLGVRQTTNALGIAGSQAGGLLAFLGTDASTKQLHPGFASHAGILAARLAAAGATGPDTVFDGPNGVYDTLADGPTDPPSIVAELGERWETTRIGIKPYPACQLSHAAMDAAAAARDQGSFGPDDIDRVVARVHPDSALIVCAADRDLAHPTSPYAAKFSLPWSVAALLVDGRVGVDTFAPEAIGRPDVAALAERVRVEISELDTAAADAAGSVDVTLRDGGTVTGRVPRSAGGPDNPLSDADLVAKATGLAGTDTAGLLHATHHLAQAADLGPLLAELDALVRPRARKTS